MKIKTLLGTNKAWVKEAYAKNANGEQVDPEENPTGAVCWCLTGAVRQCYPREKHTATWNKLSRAIFSFVRFRKRLGVIHQSGVSVVEFNDHDDTTFADIRTVVEKANV